MNASPQVMGAFAPSGVKRTESSEVPRAVGSGRVPALAFATLVAGISSLKWNTVQRSLGKAKQSGSVNRIVLSAAGGKPCIQPMAVRSVRSMP
ncbi:MAG: hypothetical protein ACTS8S_03220, partial [Giesbergeria sp.]